MYRYFLSVYCLLEFVGFVWGPVWVICKVQVVVGIGLEVLDIPSLCTSFLVWVVVGSRQTTVFCCVGSPVLFHLKFLMRGPCCFVGSKSEYIWCLHELWSTVSTTSSNSKRQHVQCMLPVLQVSCLLYLHRHVYTQYCGHPEMLLHG